MGTLAVRLKNGQKALCDLCNIPLYEEQTNDFFAYCICFLYIICQTLRHMRTNSNLASMSLDVKCGTVFLNTVFGSAIPYFSYRQPVYHPSWCERGFSGSQASCGFGKHYYHTWNALSSQSQVKKYDKSLTVLSNTYDVELFPQAILKSGLSHDFFFILKTVQTNSVLLLHKVFKDKMLRTFNLYTDSYLKDAVFTNKLHFLCISVQQRKWRRLWGLRVQSLQPLGFLKAAFTWAFLQMNWTSWHKAKRH